MAIRNSREIGENLQRVVKRILSNQNLLKLLYYSDKDPLSHDDISEDVINKEIFQKLVTVVPRVGPKETAQSLISIRVSDSSHNYSNDEFRDVTLIIDVFVPLTEWIIKSDNLRPFLILGELEDSLKGKTINGLGKISGGTFKLNFLTEEIGCYSQVFMITSYD